MKIEIDIDKTLDQNATLYFEKAKLARKKAAGLRIATIKQKDLLEKKEKDKLVKDEEKKRKKNWFEKYRWFFTSDNLLVIGGKSASQNEEIVKKHMKKNDLYFHADLHGAPHCVIKFSEAPSKLKLVPDISKKETAIFAVTFSKAFDSGVSSADAYCVKPEQVSKKAPSKMSMGTGAFMIYGERDYYKKTPVEIAIGYFNREKTLMCGPISACKKWCSNVFILKQGNLEKNKTAKLLKEKFSDKGIDFLVDDILSLLPNGKFDITN